MEQSSKSSLTPAGDSVFKSRTLESRALPAEAWTAGSSSTLVSTFPLFHVSRLLGLFPSALVGKLYVYCTMAVIVTLVVVTKIVHVRYSYAYFIKFRNPGVFTIATIFQVATGFWGALCSLTHMAKVARRGSEFVQAYSEFKTDKRLVLHPRFFTIFGLIFLIFVAGPLLYKRGSVPIIVIITFILINVLTLCIVMQFCSYLELLKAVMLSGPPPDAPESAERAVTFQHLLLRRAGSANKLFDVQLLFVVLKILNNIIIYFYGIFIHSGELEKNRTGIAFFIVLILWELFLLGVLTTSCQTIKKKADEWNIALNKLIQKYPRLQSNVVAVAFTYFVIVLQFTDPS